MTITKLSRRGFALGGLALTGLTACGRAAGPIGGASNVASTSSSSFQTASNAGYDSWVVSFKNRAVGSGYAQPVVDRAFRGAGYLPGVIERDRKQTEFTRTLEDYLAIAASDERVRNGRANFRALSGKLSSIESQYGVDAKVVAAIWGMESSYGTRRGDVHIVSAMSTLAYDGRRKDFFEKQLFAVLKILAAGDTTPENMRGSWAGAMGHTQFMPTSYLAYAVDFTGDGRRDIWADDPTDALASAANYLRQFGWTKGQPWGVEVKLPEGFDRSQAGFSNSRSVSTWTSMGVRDMNGGTVPNHGAARVIEPAGGGGPAFMVFKNFDVIKRYNNATSYAIGVGHLGDRIAGGGPIRGNFGPDPQGLTLEDRKDIQRRLTSKGFDTDGTDGVIGAKSEAAIRAFEAANGMPSSGLATKALLVKLGGRPGA
ncbi:lytic murein transglycosylase [Maritimibacter sp. UBA3975]|mgnify:CR=1 FL=1|uniref:lytic murein transglycosylase n=1 Tax=Maritimibacter sp. UBA3975 TaxID=1946833 RepID=UPI000C0A3CBB|nr:lytic murein transglycosylase [Maritimibacter sp. UBA3975]MAM60920.1 murein transglycosylase [Maritimibacter sp.]|tara:strand:+ start:2539 stop:3819 length:1281 start_codon:yes stop_codon:yes gene_type:complete